MWITLNSLYKLLLDTSIAIVILYFPPCTIGAYKILICCHFYACSIRLLINTGTVKAMPMSIEVTSCVVGQLSC